MLFFHQLLPLWPIIPHHCVHVPHQFPRFEVKNGAELPKIAHCESEVLFLLFFRPRNKVKLVYLFVAVVDLFLEHCRLSLDALVEGHE